MSAGQVRGGNAFPSMLRVQVGFVQQNIPFCGWKCFILSVLSHAVATSRVWLLLSTPNLASAPEELSFMLYLNYM